MSVILDELIVLPRGGERWIVYNPFARTCLGVETAALSLLSGEGVRESTTRYKVWDVQRFPVADGLFADPTPMIRSDDAWPAAELLSAEGVEERFRKHFLLVDSRDDYLRHFAPKRSILDRERFGNLHQQLGQQLIVTKKQRPEEWWLTQKFEPGLKTLGNNVYKWVQEGSIDRYFRERLSKKSRVVDLGCGIGHFSRLIASIGHDVLGVDPNAGYITKARELAGDGGARFEVGNVGQKGGLDAIGKASADIVFMSDALIFYFVPPVPDPSYSLEQLFGEIRRILKPGGKFINMEAHHVFWQQPWLGGADRPMTVIAEYEQSSFRVTATLTDLIQAYGRNGFRIDWMMECQPSAEFEAVDARAYHFARQFPLWHIFELSAETAGRAS